MQVTIILPITKLMYNYKISDCNKHKVIIHMVYQNNNLNTQSSPPQQHDAPIYCNKII